MSIWPFLVVAAGVGFGAGATFMGYAFIKHFSFDVWQITSPTGHTYMVADIREVEAALAIDGMLAVRRLRILA